MDTIYREQAIDIVDDIDTFCAGWRDYAISRIKALPSAEKTGRWIEHEDDWFGDYYECSVCGAAFTLIDGTPADNLYNYCPNCRARMGEKE